MARLYRVQVETVEWLLRKNEGNLQLAAQEMGVSRQALYARIKKTPSLQKSVGQARGVSAQSRFCSNPNDRNCFLAISANDPTFGAIRPGRQVRYSDLEMEKFVSLRRNIAEYRRIRSRQDTGGPHSVARWREDIVWAAAAALKISPQEVRLAYSRWWHDPNIRFMRMIDLEIARRARLKAEQSNPGDSAKASGNPSRSDLGHSHKKRIGSKSLGSA